MNSLDELITACECCEGITGLTPVEIYNRPGLSVLEYRVGTHARFKATMLARLSTQAALRALTTRQDDDLTVALLDGWATVADVVAFYQEQNANEGFLRTATEHRSLLELARTIGYELRPGVAASTYLAFTVDDSPGSPEKVIIPAGTRAQSVPGKDELPQAFETSADIAAYGEWNALRPRQTLPQLFSQDENEFYFAGTDTGVSPGDWVLVRAGETEDPENPGDVAILPRQVKSVEPDDANQRTKVILDVEDVDQGLAQGFGFAASAKPAESVFLNDIELTIANAQNLITGFNWSASDVATFETMQGLSQGQLAAIVNEEPPVTQPPEGTGVFALRVKTAPFGHNAPKYATLPQEWISETNGDEEISSGNNGDNEEQEPPYPRNWDEHPLQINQASDGTLYDDDGTAILLASTFPDILTNSWVLLRRPANSQELAIHRVVEVEELSRADFALNARVTRLTLEPAADDTPPVPLFRFRTTTIYAQSEELELAEEPIPDSVSGAELVLDRMLEHPLEAGHRLFLAGERVDTGLPAGEVVTLADVVDHPGGLTRLTFASPLKHTYQRTTVTLNANLAPATHGETRQEVLGSGDASQPFQSFFLRQMPLTYVSAPVPSGGRSTLEVRVDGVRWHEAPDFYRLGPRDRNYVLRRAAAGETQVLFGDGEHGARLPTGAENVSATYRTGIGVGGLVAAEQISLLMTRPLGVREVVNPLPSGGAEDPESRDQARQNAPLTVLTLDRIVSLQDFEDFARAFSGIAKASATWAWDGESRTVFVTVAGVDGAAVETDSEVYENLIEAMNRVRDPFQRLNVKTYEPRLFTVQASVRVHPDYQAAVVLQEVEEGLLTAFSFGARDFAQDVFLSEVMAVIQKVEGVEAVDVDVLRFSHKLFPPHLFPRLPAHPARFDAQGFPRPAQLLMVGTVKLSEMS